MGKDNIKDLITDLQGQLPEPKASLSEDEKDQIVLTVGPKTIASILSAKKQLPLKRIPFLFSSLDTQTVINILAHDFADALHRVKQKKRG